MTPHQCRSRDQFLEPSRSKPVYPLSFSGLNTPKKKFFIFLFYFFIFSLDRSTGMMFLEKIFSEVILTWIFSISSISSLRSGSKKTSDYSETETEHSDYADDFDQEDFDDNYTTKLIEKFNKRQLEAENQVD